MQGTQYLSRDFAPCAAVIASWDAQAALDDIAATFAAGKVYASVDALAQSLRAQVGALAGADEFLPWVRDNLTFKQQLSRLLSTADGVRSVTILLDTGATHCFICARQAGTLASPGKTKTRIF